MTVKKNLSLNVMDSPIGLIALAGPDPDVAFIRLQVESADQAARIIASEYDAPIDYEPDSFPELRDELKDYFNGGLRRFSTSYHFLTGTPFQREVWHYLAKIPYGETSTYALIAAAVGRPKAVRAVGQAVGSNPLPIILPCHRVIRTDGGIGGFYYGTGLKSRLIEMETNAGKSSTSR